MALVRIPDEQRTLIEPESITGFLRTHGITYERWESARHVPQDATADAVLETYADQVEKLKAQGGYTAVDVIDVKPDTPGLDGMLARFNREHWHDEDEVRFIVEGRGLFHISPPGGPVFAIEVEAGDLIRVPRGTHHWFDLCSDRRIRAIRLFQDPSGWTPHYTDSGVDAGSSPSASGRPTFRGRITGRRRERQPVCLGNPRDRPGHRGDDDAHRIRLSGAVPVRARAREGVSRRGVGDRRVPRGGRAVARGARTRMSGAADGRTPPALGGA